MAMDEQSFMDFDFMTVPAASWPQDLSYMQRQRLGKDLTDYDIPILKHGQGDPLHHLGMPVNQSDIDGFTFRYWFNYFWQEAVAADASDEEVGTALRLLLERKRYPIPPGEAFRNGGRRLPDYYRIRTDDKQRCEALEHLLKAGFVGMRRFIGPLPADLINLPFMEEAILEGEVRQKLFTRSASGRTMYWRGESRTPEQLIQQATSRAVDVPALAQKMNLDKLWHPFHRPEIKANMWYRKGLNRDNDYYTAISVAHDFETACCFPLIDERRVYNFTNADPWTWPVGELQRQMENLGVVELNGKRHIQIVTATTVYLSINRGATLFTQAVQKRISGSDPFPEHAVAEIRPEDIYGYLLVYRAFHGLGKGDGFTVFVDHAKSSRVRYDAQHKRLIKVAGPDAARDQMQFGDVCAALEREYSTRLASPAFPLAWAASGHGPPAIPRRITRLVSPPPLEGAARGFLVNKRRPPDYL